jgi:hypothetical protein
MVRALDDILLGFLIFFALDRAIRLFSNGVVEPWAQTKSMNKNVVENWKIAAELAILIVTVVVLLNNRRLMAHFNRA